MQPNKHPTNNQTTNQPIKTNTEQTQQATHTKFYLQEHQTTEKQQTYLSANKKRYTKTWERSAKDHTKGTKKHHSTWWKIMTYNNRFVKGTWEPCSARPISNPKMPEKKLATRCRRRPWQRNNTNMDDTPLSYYTTIELTPFAGLIGCLILPFIAEPRQGTFWWRCHTSNNWIWPTNW